VVFGLRVAANWKTTLVVGCLITLWAAAPFHFALTAPPGAFSFASKAFAHESGGSGGSSGGNSGSGGSGSGSGGDHSGEGSGSRGSGGNENINSGPGQQGTSDHEVSRRLGPNGEKIEIDGELIEVVYPDGWKEEIRSGVFELRDPAGRTVIRRRATSFDQARMKTLGP